VTCLYPGEMAAGTLPASGTAVTVVLMRTRSTRGGGCSAMA
jgi:hypothetical protein